MMHNEIQLQNCLICKRNANFLIHENLYDCDRCGKFSVSVEARSMVAQCEEGVASLLSHHARKSQLIHNRNLDISYGFCKSLLSKPLITPAEQADNFLIYLSLKSNSLGEPVLNLNENWDLCAFIGAPLSANPKSISLALIKELEKLGFVDKPNNSLYCAFLTLKGWDRVRALQDLLVNSRKAFMAMKFVAESDPLYQIFHNCFKSAVKRAGYTLDNALASEGVAGNIHARLEVEIRNARFVVADLTHHNNGAYWEAGFAHGLGKPVIYTCRKDIYEKKKSEQNACPDCQGDLSPHFDTAPHYTIVWELGNEQQAAEDLVSAIRATLPAEAIMEN